MHISRRKTLSLIAAGIGGTILLPAVARAQKGRSLHLELQGFSLGIHVPQVMAVRDLMVQAGIQEKVEPAANKPVEPAAHEAVEPSSAQK